MEYLFSIAARDELWSGGVLIESRASHGRANCRGNEIEAVGIGDRELIRRAESRMKPMRALARKLRDARVRLVASARRVSDYERDEASMSITIGGVSVVTTAEAMQLPAPRVSGERVPKAGEGLPILWKNGSAAVLLHEACGHAAEHHQQSSWPKWLTIHDEPAFEIDDANEPTRVVDLTREAPAASRRESFRDVPLKRMTNLVARQQNAPWSVPDERIEIELVAGGAYEPLTGMVTVSIAVADLVRGGESIPLQRFQIHVARDRVARAIAGASGEPLPYPGVVCAREGQELVVGSFAPLMLTTELL